MLWLAPEPKIAQSYAINLFMKLFSFYTESAYMIFVAKNN
jgi:hypothetical protein